MTDVLAEMETWSIATVGTSAIITRRSELANLDGRHRWPGGVRRREDGKGGRGSVSGSSLSSPLPRP